MKKVNLILPAAGLGSRFREVGVNKPKPLIDVFEIPMIMWVLLNFPLQNHDKVWIISQAKDEIPGHLKNYTEKLPYQIEFLEIDGHRSVEEIHADIVQKLNLK